MSLVIHISIWMALIHTNTDSVLAIKNTNVSLSLIDSSSAPTSVKASPQAPIQHQRKRIRSSNEIATGKKNSATEQTTTQGSNSTGDNNGGVQNEYLKYVAEIRNLILEKKTYPEYSRRLKESGQIKLEVVISSDGHIRTVEILESCPFQRLNTAALDLVKEIRQVKPFPPELAKNRELKFEIPLEYVIR